MFEKVAPYAGDPILSLLYDFIQDKRDEKVNLSIGYYYDENGKVPQLSCVKTAIDALYQTRDNAALYLPMSGLASYCQAIQNLLFGSDNPIVKSGRVVTIQTLGGSGALKIGADFLYRYFPDSQVWVSDPTWENHVTIFKGAGFTVNHYPYFDRDTSGVNFDAMLTTLSQLPAKSIVLLHPCCHNPTGADLTNLQWDLVIERLKQRDLIPFMDIAYQGFASGIDEDVYAIQTLAASGISGFISNSFSKTFSLYGERVGGLSVICDDKNIAKNVFGQLQATVRGNYSSPANTGAQIVAHVLNNPSLKALWIEEVNTMRNRIKQMRTTMVDTLKQIIPDRNFDYLLQQQGMFSYTGLTKDQVEKLKTDYAIYLVGSGRMCVAGLNNRNVVNVASAFAEVF